MFDKHSHACSEAILALIDTPAPQRFTVCDECGRNDLPAGDAVWADDGASYCKTCRTLTQPAPPADPAGDALRELREVAADVLAQVAFVPVKHPGHTHQRDRLRAALAAAPAPQPEKIMCSRCDGSGYAWAVGNCPDCNGDGWVNAPIQPAPQPDADEREALVVAMSMDIRDNIDIEWAEAKTAADALLAAGWTRKREEG